jgi:hypothetical protein
MSVGFIKLHRQITEWEWYSDVNTSRLFLHLLVTSNFKDKKWRGIEIKRGQIITSLQNLSDETSLSLRSIRTSLNKLKSTGEVTCKTTNRFSCITLTKYDSYQDKESIATHQTTRQVTNKRQSNDNQTTTTKEGKEGKEGKNINNDRFTQFWNLYDYKKSKPKAISAYEKALKVDNHDNIIIGVNAYIKARGVDKQFWKHPTTWLNNQSWLDEHCATKQLTKSKYGTQW